MISRAFIHLLPFLCLLVASSAKHSDTPSRRLSSPRRLKGMHTINIIESASPPIVKNDWKDPAMTDNRHERRFLEKKSDSARKSKTDKEGTTDKKGKKTKTSPRSIEPVSPTQTQPSATEDEVPVPVSTSIVSATDDDGLLS